MSTPHCVELPSELLEDFRQEAAEQFQRSEQLLIELEHSPDDSERLHDLFRQVHTLKGNLGYIGLSTLMPLPQAIEDVLACLRETQLRFDSLLGDILLLSLDHLKELIEQDLGGRTARLDPSQLSALSRRTARATDGNPPGATSTTRPEHPPTGTHPHTQRTSYRIA